MKNLISRVQRELPDTDKDRYDVAYERGATQKRSGMLFGGLAAGAIAGLVGMYLLDPVRGAARRSQVASRLAGLGNDVARTAGSKAEDIRNRAKGAAIESGVREPSDFEPSAEERRNGSAEDIAAVAVGTAIATDASASAAPAPSGIDTPSEAALTGPNGIVASPDFERPVLDADLGADAPGSDVDNPLTPEELEEYGPSGPVAGAATAAANEEAARDAATQAAATTHDPTNEEAAPAD